MREGGRWPPWCNWSRLIFYGVQILFFVRSIPFCHLSCSVLIDLSFELFSSVWGLLLTSQARIQISSSIDFIPSLRWQHARWFRSLVLALCLCFGIKPSVLWFLHQGFLHSVTDSCSRFSSGQHCGLACPVHSNFWSPPARADFGSRLVAMLSALEPCCLQDPVAEVLVRACLPLVILLYLDFGGRPNLRLVCACFFSVSVLGAIARC
jgi:hypothetical protein